jgi:hypothetical protein
MGLALRMGHRDQSLLEQSTIEGDSPVNGHE